MHDITPSIDFLAIIYICGLKIRIEKHRLPQCHRCQLFGHADKACHMPPRRVKCSGNHLTRDCKKEAGEATVCANCKGDHPASYRGCPVYTKLKQRLNDLKNKAHNKIKTTENPQALMTNGKKDFEPLNREVTRSYAGATRGEGAMSERPLSTNNNVMTSSIPTEEEIVISETTSSNDEDDDWRVIMSKWISHLALLIVKPGLTRTGFISHVINSTHLLLND
ncbi:hypothetical protein J437_LFUL010717 [Ladona fulva]|uniref:Nucleic-acid-binding protein from mobile element jockey n=1 Tax=Ladona fulva TaxID=123851 RepID=A0A8K0K3W7_LADFU|nr:hypothetical protein J437_LFUL010717 [Ladona fulva]